MGKWTSDEHLHFYTFIIFNFGYIFKKKILNGGETPSSKSSRKSSTKKDLKKKRRGKQLSGEFYTKMEEFFEVELPDHERRTRSQLRCKMNKIFPKEKFEDRKKRKERWENGSIYFSDLVKIMGTDQNGLHVSGFTDRVHIPFRKDCDIIEQQILDYFGISFRVEELPPLDQKTLNSVSWRDFNASYYPLYGRFIKEMTRQKEIFRRDVRFLNENKPEELKRKKEEFDSWLGLMKNAIKKTERGLLYLSAEYELLKKNEKLLSLFKNQSSLSMKKISNSRSKTISLPSNDKEKTFDPTERKEVKVKAEAEEPSTTTLLKKRRNISKFSSSIPSKSRKSSSLEKSVKETQENPGFQKPQKVKKKKVQVISGFNYRLKNPIPLRKIFPALKIKQEEEDTEEEEVTEVDPSSIKFNYENDESLGIKLEAGEEKNVSSFTLEKYQEQRKELLGYKINSFEKNISLFKGFTNSMFKRNSGGRDDGNGASGQF